MTDLIEDALAELDTIEVPVTWADVERRANEVTPTSDAAPAHAHRTDWRLVAVAAVALLVAGVGVGVAVTRDDPLQVASGDGATTTVAATPGSDRTVSSGDPADLNAGIWRWPTDVMGDPATVTHATTGTSWFGFQLAVDDPDDPTRWLGILPGDAPYFEDRDGPGASGRFDDVTTYAIYDARPDSDTNATWAELTRAGGGNVTVSAKGLDPQAIIRVLDEIHERAPLLSIDAVLDAIPELAVPDGLTPEWSPILPGTEALERARPTQLSLGLTTPAGQRFDVAVEYLGLPPAVASLDMVLQFEASRIGERVERRDDLGPGALTIGPWAASGNALATSYVLFTDTGERITVSEPGGTEAVVGPPTLQYVAQHLELLPEAELRARLSERGVTIVDTDDLGS